MSPHKLVTLRAIIFLLKLMKVWELGLNQEFRFGSSFNVVGVVVIFSYLMSSLYTYVVSVYSLLLW